MIRKVLIANRGEIAVRIIRTCREMGILTVAVYSEADREALHAQLADEAVCIGPAPSKESYLNMERILSAALVTGADAIHPGFGFLSENSTFARRCQECRITWIGPSPEVMDRLGNKSEARNTMKEAGVPVIPGTKAPVFDWETGLAEADRIGFPVMIKAALGGGGKGMRMAETREEFPSAFQTAQKEAQASFADGTMYVERLIRHPRHVEFQIMADSFGNVIHLGERDCSIQRNHQKMIEESPCMAIGEKLRERMGRAAVRAAKAAHYVNAGTIEFLLEPDGNFYFMEMNTRIQVEHPVTEWVTGVDLIREQLRVASGLALSVTQEEVLLSGHAIECRINAENPAKNFRPCPGKITELHLPGGFGVRVDTAAYGGYVIPAFYDSMLAKLIVHGKTREEAIARMRSALGEVVIEGVDTNVDYLYSILNEEEYLEGKADIEFVERLTFKAIKVCKE
ncbi:acetyl-CoA carboxylase biotin carboxylase subunit [Fusicatenibacter sp.]